MIPLVKPTLPKLKSLQNKLRDIFKSGMLTNARYVEEFEKKCANFFGAQNVIAVANGASAIIMVLKCLDLKGEVILPSFTFTATAHSLLWCGLTPVFADIDPETFNIDPVSIEKNITPKTSGILAVHVFGNPCEIDKIQKIAKTYNLKVIYDAAHAFGSKYKNKSVAFFGNASTFSLTPTKVLTTAEGGLIAAKSQKFAKILKLARNNGDSINRKEEFLGISARMDEFSAILGIESLKILPKFLKRRLKLVNFYKKELSGVPGISFQKVRPHSFSVYKDLAILVDKRKFGLSRNGLLKELWKRNIEAKVYFDLPIHRKKVYRKYQKAPLPKTDFISNNIMDLPLYSHMPKSYVMKVCTVIKNLYKSNKKIL